jgi:hypothetical protein
VSYYFRREDNGEILEVDWTAMMNMDVAGYITLDDGVQARRCQRPSMRRKGEVPQGAAKFEHVSNIAFAVPPSAVESFADDAKRNGFNIEWKPDYKGADADGTINSFNAHIPLSQLNRYRKHRLGPDAFDKNSKNGRGAVIYADDIEKSKKLVERQYATEAK